MTLISRIGEFGGVPTVFINGEPVFLLGYKDGSQSQTTYENFRDAGYQTAYCNVKIEEIWISQGVIDLDVLHASLDRIIESNHDAYIILELHANAPDWWLNIHPDEEQVDRSGQKYGQSLASELWFTETCQVIRNIVRECEKVYGDHVILYLVGAGHTWEWFYRTPLRYVVDCSAPMITAYRRWLRSKYENDSHIKAARVGENSINHATIPAWEEIITGDLGSIRDPSRQRTVIDFFEFYNTLAADLIIKLAQIIKEECGGRKLFGAFYGHLLDWIDNPLTGQHSGHFGLRHVLASDLVDVLAGPNSYMNRSMGHMTSFPSITDSIKLHGKLWLAETDTRTSLADPIQDICGRPETIEASLALLQRDFCHALVQGVDMAWFSLFRGWYDDLIIMRFMAQAHAIANRALRTERGSVAEVAVFVDEHSILASTGRDAYRVDPFISMEPRASDLLAHMGCPFDIYLTTDLNRVEVSQYKVFIWLNCTWLDEDILRAIQTHIKRDQKYLVWIGLPGLVNGNLDIKHAADLIGMNLDFRDTPSEAFIKVLWGVHPILPRENLGTLLPTWVDGDFEGYFGTNQLLSPRLFITDSEAIALGRYSRDGEVGFAYKEFGGWKSVFIGTPFAPPAILRQIVRYAGVHIYNQSDAPEEENSEEFQRAGWSLDAISNPGDDPLDVNDSFLALHIKHGGRRRIVLPEPRRISDVFNGMVVSEETDTIEMVFPKNQTILYYIGKIPWEELG